MAITVNSQMFEIDSDLVWGTVVRIATVVFQNHSTNFFGLKQNKEPDIENRSPPCWIVEIPSYHHVLPGLPETVAAFPWTSQEFGKQASAAYLRKPLNSSGVIFDAKITSPARGCFQILNLSFLQEYRPRNSLQV